MPTTPTYPGVYIEEIPSGVRTITGVATSITAFVGRTLKGPANEPVRIQNFGDFTRQFGGLWNKSTLSYAVQHYFLNGGRDAIIVRVHKDAIAAQISVGGLSLVAASPGVWSNSLRAIVDLKTKKRDDGTDDPTLFNLTIQELKAPGSDQVIAAEILRNLSISESAARFYKKVIEQESVLVDVEGVTLTTLPTAATGNGDGSGADGTDVTDAQIAGADLQANREGLYALDKADLFNLLCIPPLSRDTDVGVDTTLANAAQYCKTRRALLIIDPPAAWSNLTTATGNNSADNRLDDLRSALGGEAVAEYAAIYFPRLKMADPLKENRTEEFAPCGAIAGIFARTDAERGVWKAPAGTEASLLGVRELSYKLSDGENGVLNPLGLNSIRSFPVYGNVVWGARTLAGADQLASEWKYVPVRRLALFLEESLFRGTQWVVFEPNDEPLWAQIRLNIGAFLNNLFRQSAFQGKTPKEAYFVKCDSETTTQNDINLGIVNVVIGFAPLKPAEFVILKFQQMAGQISA